MPTTASNGAVDSQDGVQAAVLAKNPIDLIALFVKTFDVPKSN